MAQPITKDGQYTAIGGSPGRPTNAPPACRSHSGRGSTARKRTGQAWADSPPSGPGTVEGRGSCRSRARQ